MNRKFLLACLLLPVAANARELPTVEVNMDVLNKFRNKEEKKYTQPEQSFEVSTRPPAPRYEAPAGYPAPPIGSYHPTPAPAPEVVAEEEGNKLGIPGEFSGNVALTTDYAFRGISQTREGPAIQGGVDYEHPSGGYIGLWASSIDFGDLNASTEMDYYGGYSQEIAPNLTADGGLIYYNYPSAKSGLNYDFIEGYVGLEYMANIAEHDVTTNATLNYSPDYFGSSGSSYYAKLAASTPVGGGFTVDGSLGHQWVEDNATFLLPDYTDYSIGVAYEIEGFEVKAQYVATSLDESDCADGCDAKGILSLSKSL